MHFSRYNISAVCAAWLAVMVDVRLAWRARREAIAGDVVGPSSPQFHVRLCCSPSLRTCRIMPVLARMITQTCRADRAQLYMSR